MAWFASPKVNTFLIWHGRGLLPSLFLSQALMIGGGQILVVCVSSTVGHAHLVSIIYKPFSWCGSFTGSGNGWGSTWVSLVMKVLWTIHVCNGDGRILNFWLLCSVYIRCSSKIILFVVNSLFFFHFHLNNLILGMKLSRTSDVSVWQDSSVDVKE